ncbi:MAG: L,D-transpeptidase [Chloroflexaceae bacterium]|nr:L,D-transpeptidase [Chloroflexaceae bacterium]
MTRTRTTRPPALRLSALAIVIVVVVLLALLLPASRPMALVQPVRAGGEVAEPFADYYWQYHGERTLGYVNSPLLEVDGYRVQYFEKGRLEDHRHEADHPAPGIVRTSLTQELIQNAPYLPVDTLPVTYGDLAAQMTPFPPPEGYEQGTSTMTTEGVFVPADPELQVVPGFIVPPYFWTYLTRRSLFPGGWMHDVGLPLTHAFSVDVGSDGEQDSPTKTLVMQAFERTVLIYDPSEVEGWSVTQANLGTDALWSRGEIPAPQQPAPPPLLPASGPRRIEVSLQHQWLFAYEGDRLVMDAPVSTGKDRFNTPTGRFAISTKIPRKTLQGRIGGESWYFPDVPSIMFYFGEVAIHGVYWHHRFGTGERLSHGCVGLAPADAAELYAWARPGTPVIVY